MRSDLSTTETTGKNIRDIPIHVPASNELKHFLQKFWNMVDPHTLETAELEPKIEVAENKDAVTVSAELPGIDAKDIDLQISSDGYLTISGEKKSTKEHNNRDNYFSEIYYGMVKRTIPLPWDLDYNKADAKYNDGLLSIEIPKTQVEKAKVKKINVNKM